MERRSIAVEGVVQGVGFRPFVFSLASRLKLRGSVKNRAGGVLIEVEGEAQSLDRFLLELTRELPPLAKIDRLSWDRQSPRGECDFELKRSETDQVVRSSSRPTWPLVTTAWLSCSVLVTADIAIRSSIAPTVDRGSRSSRARPMTGAHHHGLIQNVRRGAEPSMRIQRIVVFMPSQRHVRPVGRNFNYSTLKASGSKPAIRLLVLSQAFATVWWVPSRVLAASI